MVFPAISQIRPNYYFILAQADSMSTLTFLVLVLFCYLTVSNLVVKCLCYTGRYEGT